MKHNSQLASAILSGFVLTAVANAQTVEDFQTWGSVTAIGSLSVVNPELKSFKYWLEGQGRFGDENTRMSQGMLRAGLGYALTPTLSLWLGYAWIPTDKPFASKAFEENRVWQQLLWNEKFSFATLTSRSRLEQRFVETGHETGWRFREMLKASVPLPFANNFSFVVSDELFVNLNQNDWVVDDGMDQNRLFAGIGYSFNGNVKTEVGYMNQYIRKATAPDRISNILSVNLLLNY